MSESKARPARRHRPAPPLRAYERARLRVAVRRGLKSGTAEGLPTRATRASRSRVVAGTSRGGDGRRLNARTASSRSRWRKSSVGMRFEGTAPARPRRRTWTCRRRQTGRRCAPAGHRSCWRPDGARAWSRPIANSANQSLDNRDARQKHLVGDEPAAARSIRGAGSIVAAPAQGRRAIGSAGNATAFSPKSATRCVRWSAR